MHIKKQTTYQTTMIDWKKMTELDYVASVKRDTLESAYLFASIDINKAMIALIKIKGITDDDAIKHFVNECLLEIKKSPYPYAKVRSND